MAIDLERIRNKLEELKNPSKRGQNPDRWFPPQDGKEAQIRLIAYPFTEDPFVELWFYYGLGRPGILSTRTKGKTDPIHAFRQTLNNSEDETDQKLWKELGPKQRMHAVVIDRADADPRPRFWQFGKKVYQQLLEALMNSETRHYLNPENGIDLIVKREKFEKQSYPETTITFKRSDSPLADSPEEIQAILKKVKRIEEVFKPLTNSEMQQRLDQWLSPSEDEEVDDAAAEARSSETVRGSVTVSDDEADEEADDYDIEAELEEAIENAQV